VIAKVLALRIIVCCINRQYSARPNPFKESIVMFRLIATITAVPIILSALVGCSSLSSGSDNSLLLDKEALPVEADEAAEIGETVTLTYVAQPYVTAYIDYYGDVIEVKDGVETVQMTMSGSQRSQSSAHPDGILVKTDQHEFDIETDDEQISQFMDPILEAMSSVEVSAVISDAGEISKLEGMKPILESTNKSISDMIETLPEEIKPMVNSLAETSLTEEAVLRRAQEDWDLAVTQWIGAELEKGYIYELEYTDTVPEFGDIEIGFDGVYEYLGKVACNEEDQAQSCVELSYQSTMKTEYAESLTKAIAENLNLPLEDDFLMSIKLDVIVVAEPSTLTTHEVSKVKSVRAPADDGSGGIEKIDRTSILFFYE